MNFFFTENKCNGSPVHRCLYYIIFSCKIYYVYYVQNGMSIGSLHCEMYSVYI